MDRARIRVDFNEMVEPDLVLLSKSDVRTDSAGNEIMLTVGTQVYIYCPDVNDFGQKDNLIADGYVERNTFGGWTSAAKWCCRIDERGIRWESDLLSE